eukprot:15132300-Alexandrium_andersonii.AAC.1
MFGPDLCALGRCDRGFDRDLLRPATAQHGCDRRFAAGARDRRALPTNKLRSEPATGLHSSVAHLARCIFFATELRPGRLRGS